MPTVAAFRFIAGQYHATPWGRNVNEGAVEWPPSPWRLLRTLYATWQARAPHHPEDVVASLLEALSEPPAFVLPETGEGHTRHYLPDTKHGTDKALDAFASVAPTDELYVEWPIDLDDGQRAVLADLLALVPYIGRAESVCEGRLVDDADRPGGDGDTGAGGAGAGAAAAAAWGRAAHQRVEPLLDDDGGHTVRLLAPELPLDLSALLVRTVELHKARLLRPPGTRWVAYERPERARTHTGNRRPDHQLVTALRWTIGNTALPRAQLAVEVGDALRTACMSRYQQRHGSSLPAVLTGKDPHGQPSTAQHLHAHHLAFSRKVGGRRLDSIVVWAPGGFEPAIVAALAELTHVHPQPDRLDRRGMRPLRVGLEAIGSMADLAPELVGAATAWETFTPFAPSRYPKRNVSWPEHLEVEVRRELELRGLPDPVRVHVVAGDWAAYRTYRASDPHRHARKAAGLRLEFAEAIEGPLALGALSHFGLGLFVPLAVP